MNENLRDAYFDECKRRSCNPNSCLAAQLPEKGDTLRELDLSKNFVGKNGLKSVLIAVRKHAPNLTTVNVQDNYLDNEAVADLCKILDGHPSLTHVHLERNLVSHSGGKAIRWFVMRNPKIVHVGLEGTFINKALIKIIDGLTEGRRTTSNAADEVKNSTCAPAVKESTTETPSSSTTVEAAGQPLVTTGSGENVVVVNVKSIGALSDDKSLEFGSGGSSAFRPQPSLVDDQLGVHLNYLFELAVKEKDGPLLGIRHMWEASLDIPIVHRIPTRMNALPVVVTPEVTPTRKAQKSPPGKDLSMSLSTSANKPNRSPPTTGLRELLEQSNVVISQDKSPRRRKASMQYPSLNRVLESCRHTPTNYGALHYIASAMSSAMCLSFNQLSDTPPPLNLTAKPSDLVTPPPSNNNNNNRSDHAALHTVLNTLPALDHSSEEPVHSPSATPQQDFAALRTLQSALRKSQEKEQKERSNSLNS